MPNKNTEKYSLRYCAFCNKPFFILLAKAKQTIRGGAYCSKPCSAQANFKRKKFTNKAGYVILPVRENGRVFQKYEHREVMRAWLGRCLERHEVVHHKDHDKKNNSIQNLEILTPAQHNNHHHNIYGSTKCFVSRCEKIAKVNFMCDGHNSMNWKKVKRRLTNGS